MLGNRAHILYMLGYLQFNHQVVKTIKTIHELLHAVMNVYSSHFRAVCLTHSDCALR